MQVMVGNLFWGMRFCTCKNFWTSTDFYLVESPKIITNTKATPPLLRLRFCESQNLVKNNRARSAHLESRPLRGAKNRIQGCSSATADFLLEADKRGSPPKSEKAAAFWRVGGAGRGVQPFLRKEKGDKFLVDSSADLSAKSRYKIVSKINFSKVPIQ